MHENNLVNKSIIFYYLAGFLISDGNDLFYPISVRSHQYIWNGAYSRTKMSSALKRDIVERCEKNKLF